MQKTKGKKTPSLISSNPDLYYFDEAAAQRPVDFMCKFCTHVKGELAGQPKIPMDWQIKDIIYPLYGWKKKSDGKRKHKTLFVQVPRKNDKTTLVATLILYNFFADNIVGFEAYVAAADREQASILFTEIMKPMIDANPVLSKASEIYSRTVVRPKTRGKVKVLASDGPRLHGLNADTVVIDEMWAMMTEKQEEAINALVTSVATKVEPMIIKIGTPGYDRQSKAYQEYQYAKAVLNGTIKDDTLLAVIYEASEQDDPFSQETWEKANPGYGMTVKLDYLKQVAEKAKLIPSELNVFKRLHLGMWTKAETVFIPAHVWNKGNLGLKTFEDFKDRDCFLGVDLANYSDLLPVCYIFPEGDKVDVIMDYWVTEEKANDRKSKNEADYIAWASSGHVRITPGNVADYQVIRKRINEVARIVKIKMIGYDDWNASQFAQDLASDGHQINPWSPHNFKLWHKPTQVLEAMATSDPPKINHMGNPVLSWNVENVVIRYNGEYMKPDKSKSKDKIDGVIALIIALGEWMNDKNIPEDIGIYIG
jgi:phage terminase large subunit-like protein